MCHLCGGMNVARQTRSRLRSIHRPTLQYCSAVNFLDFWWQLSPVTPHAQALVRGAWKMKSCASPRNYGRAGHYLTIRGQPPATVHRQRLHSLYFVVTAICDLRSGYPTPYPAINALRTRHYLSFRFQHVKINSSVPLRQFHFV
jgi:hypothetical protein